MKKNNKNDTSNCIALGLALGLIFGLAFHYPGMGLFLDYVLVLS